MTNIAYALLEACLGDQQVRPHLRAYQKTFELIKADTPELQEQAFHLRYDVFYREYGVEDLNDDLIGKRIESDRYDPRADHYLLMHHASSQPIGTIRVVYPDTADIRQSFPIQQICDHPLLFDESHIRRMCEISSFCMSPQFRQREGDGRFLPSYSKQDTTKGHIQGMITYMRRKIPYAPAALLRGAFESSLSHGIEDCFWMVDPEHLPSLRNLGFTYQTLGPKILYHGLSVPIVLNIKSALDNIRRTNKSCWEVITEDGRLQDMADAVSQNHWRDGMMTADITDQVVAKLT